MLGVNIYDIRRVNLERLLRESGMPLNEFARKSGVSAIYLTQVMSDRTKRHMGDKVARRIEDNRELPSGWMDAMAGRSASLSELAMKVATKFDTLPEPVKERIAREIDTLHRYNADR